MVNMVNVVIVIIVVTVIHMTSSNTRHLNMMDRKAIATSSHDSGLLSLQMQMKRLMKWGDHL